MSTTSGSVFLDCGDATKQDGSGDAVATLDASEPTVQEICANAAYTLSASWNTSLTRHAKMVTLFQFTHPRAVEQPKPSLINMNSLYQLLLCRSTDWKVLASE